MAGQTCLARLQPDNIAVRSSPCHAAARHPAPPAQTLSRSCDTRATLRFDAAARRTSILRTAADGASASTAPGEAPSPPSFTVVFEEADGTRTLENVESGDILRDVMLDADPPVDLYTTWGKVVTCGGGGQCGTCAVEVLEGGDLLDAWNDTEQKKLKKKPESFRLACQLNVGDGENSGTLRVRTKPK